MHKKPFEQETLLMVGLVWRTVEQKNLLMADQVCRIDQKTLKIVDLVWKTGEQENSLNVDLV